MGGAARFKTALDSFSHLNPLTLFSGDALSPSNSKSKSFKMLKWVIGSSLFFVAFMCTVSVVMKGEQMVPVLNSLDIQCAVYGNHDFGELQLHT